MNQNSIDPLAWTTAGSTVTEGNMSAEQLEEEILRFGSALEAAGKMSNNVSANNLVRRADSSIAGLDMDGGYFWDIDTLILLLILAPVEVVMPLAIAPLLGLSSLWLYIPVAAVSVLVWFWLPACQVCLRGRRIHFRRRNELVDIYEDPASLHWLMADVGAV